MWQGRREGFFQGRTLVESRGGLPAICYIQYGGGGSTLIFGHLNGQNERIFGPGAVALWPSLANGCLRLCNVRVCCARD